MCTFPAAASGGPLEILEALTPVMSATVLILSLVWEHLWIVLPRSAFFSTFQQTFMTLLLIFMGAVLAFMLVWTEYQLIKVWEVWAGGRGQVWAGAKCVERGQMCWEAAGARTALLGAAHMYGTRLAAHCCCCSSRPSSLHRRSMSRRCCTAQETSALTFMIAGTCKEIVTGEPCMGP